MCILSVFSWLARAYFASSSLLKPNLAAASHPPRENPLVIDVIVSLSIRDHKHCCFITKNLPRCFKVDFIEWACSECRFRIILRFHHPYRWIILDAEPGDEKSCNLWAVSIDTFFPDKGQPSLTVLSAVLRPLVKFNSSWLQGKRWENVSWVRKIL